MANDGDITLIQSERFLLEQCGEGETVVTLNSQLDSVADMLLSVQVAVCALDAGGGSFSHVVVIRPLSGGRTFAVLDNDAPRREVQYRSHGYFARLRGGVRVHAIVKKSRWYVIYQHSFSTCAKRTYT